MYRTVLAWTREHPRTVDGAVAGAVFLYNLPIQSGYVQAPMPYLVTALLSVGVCFPYIVRRERPVLTFAVMAVATSVQILLGVLPFPAGAMLFFGLYNVASRCGRRTSVAAAAVLGAGSAVAVLQWESDVKSVALNLAYCAIWIVSVWVWGATIGTRRAYLTGLEERAVHLERERDHQARLATAAERARIAREMHDVVSHSLSVMVVQADGATYALRDHPDRAEQALATISTTGRTALAEMRSMLGVLREGDPGLDGYAPQPGMAQLDQLTDDARRTGLPVEFTVHGTPRALPTGMELAVYRIVQESLTNARKHAGPQVGRVQVGLWFGDTTVEVRVTDDGRGAAALLPAPDTAGHGLLGMRERVTAYSGTLHHGPRAGGGFEVVASLPIER